MASDWQVARPGRVCAGCGRSFDVGETFRALLYEAPQGYERHEYCAACTVPEQPVPIGAWKARRPPDTTKKTPVFDREAIYRFFLRLEDAADPEKMRVRFVLALLLWRKKVLKFERTADVDGRESWEFSAAASGETHRVARPELAEDQLEALSQQLEQVLAGQWLDLETPAGTEEPVHDAGQV